MDTATKWAIGLGLTAVGTGLVVFIMTREDEEEAAPTPSTTTPQQNLLSVWQGAGTSYPSPLAPGVTVPATAPVGATKPPPTPEQLAQVKAVVDASGGMPAVISGGIGGILSLVKNVKALTTPLVAPAKPT